jgi:disulfide bond formation protein DsbB
MNRSLSPDVARILNLIGLLAMIGVLLGSYIYQFSYRELPCTLCLLQRLAMLGVAFGAAMNVSLGPDPRHYGICLVSAIFGLSVSIRQTLLHINPFFNTKTSQPTLDAAANAPFGEAVLGLHLYVWGIVIFATVILSVGIVQLFRSQFVSSDHEPTTLRGMASIGVGLLFLATAAVAVTTFMECGFGDCPNDGSWHWWLFG